MSLGFAKVGRAVQENSLQVSKVPAPVKGVDARAPAGNMDPELCVYAYNMMPAEYGMLLRDGYRQWVVDIEDVPSEGLGVRTLMAYDGLTTGLVDDRLFAVTNEGIWDVTQEGVPPILKFTFADQTGDAGHGVYAHYVDQSGESFLYYADSENGLFEYSEITDLWVQASGIQGPDVEDIVFVMVHKQRMWFGIRDSSVGWYLPVASNSGQAEEFFFGAKFPHGGKLAGLFNWTVDGGSGVDDYLVVFSTAGDVIPYQGDDPSSAETWEVRGTYFVGKLPRGRRFASEFSGNLYFLSSYGLMAMSDLLRGVDSKDMAADSLSYRVARPLRLRLADSTDSLLWEPKFIPSKGILVVVGAKAESRRYEQFGMNLSTEGWGTWRDVPINCIEEWNNRVYFGTVDNTVQVMDVGKDAVVFDPPDPQNNGKPITFSILTSYQDGDAPGIFKQVQMIRPDFVGVGAPNYQVKALYDYSLQEPPFANSPNNPVGTDGWDIGEWDTALWGGGLLGGNHTLVGAGGIGRYVAIAITGDAEEQQRLISFDIMWTAGGPI